jgi:cobalamin synthase
MWDQYKKTFRGMQAVMLLVSVCVFLATGDALIAGVFFLAMQVSSVVGAMWAYRLRRKFEGASPDSISATRLRRR